MKSIHKIIKEFKHISREEKEKLKESLYNSRFFDRCEFYIGEKVKVTKFNKYLYIHHLEKPYKLKSVWTIYEKMKTIVYTYKIKI